jgi:pyruvate ferredoxin oxidoreductase alpha subunit
VYSFFRYQMHLAAQNVLRVHAEVALDFEHTFGRHYGLVDPFEVDDADYVLVMAGSFATKAKAAIRVLREEGKRVGLVRLRLIRPFPAAAVGSLLAGRRGVAVIDQNLSPGSGGILFQEIAGALINSPSRPRTCRSFVGGLGGKNLSLAEFRHVLEVLEQDGDAAPSGEAELLFTDADWKQVEPMISQAQLPASSNRKPQASACG